MILGIHRRRVGLLWVAHLTDGSVLLLSRWGVTRRHVTNRLINAARRRVLAPTESTK